MIPEQIKVIKDIPGPLVLPWAQHFGVRTARSAVLALLRAAPLWMAELELLRAQNAMLVDHVDRILGEVPSQGRSEPGDADQDGVVPLKHEPPSQSDGEGLEFNAW